MGHEGTYKEITNAIYFCLHHNVLRCCSSIDICRLYRIQCFIITSLRALAICYYWRMTHSYTCIMSKCLSKFRMFWAEKIGNFRCCRCLFLFRRFSIIIKLEWRARRFICYENSSINYLESLLVVYCCSCD